MIFFPSNYRIRKNWIEISARTNVEFKWALNSTCLLANGPLPFCKPAKENVFKKIKANRRQFARRKLSSVCGARTLFSLSSICMTNL